MSSTGGPHPRVAVVDDHDVVHAGLEAWLADAGIRVATRARDRSEALALVRADEVDVVILDLMLGGSTPDVDLLGTLVADGLRVVVHSSLTSRAVILDCLERGAATYLVKNEGREHLVHAVTEVALDRPYIGPTMAGAMAEPPERTDPGLSTREVQVLLAWFRTESKELVSNVLHIAPGTVSTHLGRARAKYAAVGRPAPTKSALLVRAIQDGLIDPDEL